MSGEQRRWDSLTPTEVTVVALIEEGLTNREIAARLMRSRRTVATHVEHILAKLGVGSRAAIASESVRHRRSREV